MAHLFPIWQEYLKLAARDRTLSVRPSSLEIRTTEEKATWGWQSSLCVSPWSWCCWWRWAKAVSLTPAISHCTSHLCYWLNPCVGTFCDCFCWRAHSVPIFRRSPLLHTLPRKSSPREEAEKLHDPGGHRFLQHQGSDVRTYNQCVWQKHILL